VRTLLNILFLVFGGFVIFLEYMLGGLLLCLTIVGIPWGIQCMKLAVLGLWPFGRDIVDEPTGALGGTLRLVLNVLWILVAGIWIFLSHLALALSLAVTIIGLPFAYQHLKFSMLALAPFGQRVVVRP
jgi:uncharacterized membrane protein YccF (DUF307 family)